MRVKPIQSPKDFCEGSVPVLLDNQAKSWMVGTHAISRDSMLVLVCTNVYIRETGLHLCREIFSRGACVGMH